MSEQHLLDLFNVGKVVPIEVVDDADPSVVHKFEIWMRRPTVGQNQEAHNKAEAKAARFRRLLREEDSDPYMRMWEEVNKHDREGLIRELVLYESQQLLQTARNEVLYSEEVGSDWSEDGLGYSSTMLAVEQRAEEIVTHNQGLGDGEEGAVILPESDEELTALRKTVAVFDREVQERKAVLEEAFREQLAGLGFDSLQERFRKEVEDLEVRLRWFEHYKFESLFFSCRFEHDHKKLYFESADAIRELPAQLQDDLFEAFDALRGGSKN